MSPIIFTLPGEPGHKPTQEADDTTAAEHTTENPSSSKDIGMTNTSMLTYPYVKDSATASVTWRGKTFSIL